MASSAASAAVQSIHEPLCIGEFTRKLFTAYSKYLKLLQKKEPSHQSTHQSSLSEALSSTKYGSVPEKCVTLLLDYLQQCNHKYSHDSINGSLTWAEFCVVAVELLFDSKELPTSNRVCPSYLTCGNTTTTTNEESTGGSCNPTVWRTNISIPLLEAAGIEYYNPQVDKWHAELITIEARAKRDAAILLFVVDAQTRAISSMVEIAFLIGAGRSLVVVINDINENKPLTICGQTLCDREITDLNRGRCALREILRLHSVIVEQSIADGTQTVINILKHRLSSDELADKCCTTKNKEEEKIKAKRACDQLIFISNLFELYKNNINHLLTNEAAQVQSQLQILTDHEDTLVATIASLLISINQSRDPISLIDPIDTIIDPIDPPTIKPIDPSTIDSSSTNPVTSSTSISNPSVIVPPPSPHSTSISNVVIGHSSPTDVGCCSNLAKCDYGLNPSSDTLFDTFCVCLSELKHRAIVQPRHGFDESLGSMVCTPLKWFTDWVGMSTTPHVTVLPQGGCSNIKCDVFLGGSCGDWRDTIAIPLLRKHNITYINPCLSEWNHSTLKLESQIKDSCTLLLYVITGETLSIESLIEAAYHIGSGRQVVLAVQDIPVGENGFTTVHGIKFSEAFLKDYNRGRSYLKGLAKSAGVIAHDNLLDAVTSCIETIQRQQQEGMTNSSRRGVKRPLSPSPSSNG